MVALLKKPPLRLTCHAQVKVSAPGSCWRPVSVTRVPSLALAGPVMLATGATFSTVTVAPPEPLSPLGSETVTTTVNAPSSG